MNAHHANAGMRAMPSRLLTSIDCPVTVLELTLDGDREALAWLRAARGLPGLAQLRVVGAVVPAHAWADVAGVACALQRVTLDGCANVTDGALAALAGLPQLRALRLRRCPLCTATGLSALATHAARATLPVRELHLVDCVRVRTLPPRLCATLERLLLADQWPLALALFVRPPLPMSASTLAAQWPVLRDLQLPDLAPGVLQTDRLPELEQLRLPTDLRTLSLSGARFPALPVQPRHTVLAAAHLTALNLSGTTLTDADVTDVLAPAVGPHLAWLDVRRTRTTSAAVPTYCKWERLEVLLLAHTKVDRIAAEVADRLAALPRLRCLDVRGCPIVDPLNLVLRLHPLVRVRWHDDDGDGETVKANSGSGRSGGDSGGDYDGALRRLPHAPMPATWTELAGFEIATG